MSVRENIEVLFIKYLNNQCSGEEVELLLQQFDVGENEAVLRVLIKTELERKESFADENDEEHAEVIELVYDHISRQIRDQQQARKTVALPVYKKYWLRAVAVAAVVFMVAIGTYLFFNPVSEKHEIVIKNVKLENDVAPGGDKAMLTLADGSVIILDSAANGTLTEQGNSKILKLNAGRLAYNKSGEKANGKEEVLYNTLSTMRGGRYQLALSDGTEVWLNAESSITFPTIFTGKERTVSIKGEAYFEVKPLVAENGLRKSSFFCSNK